MSNTRLKREIVIMLDFEKGFFTYLVTTVRQRGKREGSQLKCGEKDCKMQKDEFSALLNLSTMKISVERGWKSLTGKAF